MVKREIEYENYEGEKVKEPFYFNLTKAELQELDFEIPGGFEGMIEKLKKNPSNIDVVNSFKKILGKAYGEKLPNGKIYKTKENAEAFFASDAYSELFYWMISDEDNAMKFIEGMLPKEIAENVPDLKPQVIIK